jgi:hypothetical protein
MIADATAEPEGHWPRIGNVKTVPSISMPSGVMTT